MDRERRNPFHGLVDSISEWNRMRELGSGRIGPETGHEDRRRTYATAWVPSTDVVARGRDLVMNPSAKAAGLSFQLSSPIEIRDGPKSEQRSDLRPHDNGPEARGTRICSYSDCEILYPAAVSPPEP